MATFWNEYRNFCVRCWKEPYWYVAVLLFCVGPFTNSFPPPWWAAIYIPLMLVFISFTTALQIHLVKRSRVKS